MDIRLAALFAQFSAPSGGRYIDLQAMRALLTSLRIEADCGGKGYNVDAFVMAEIAKADADNDCRLNHAEFVTYFTSYRQLPAVVEEEAAPVCAAADHHSSQIIDFMAPRRDSRGQCSEEEARERSLLRHVQNLTHERPSDYSRGLSGTREDTECERSLAQVMRGVDVQESGGAFAVSACHCAVSDTGQHAPDCAGKWLRATNHQSGAFLYVHSITHEITARRPVEFHDPEEERRKALLVAAGEFPDFATCFLETLEAETARIVEVERKTPLILAGCEEMHAEVLAWAATRSEDPAHKPGDATPAIQRAYVVNTRSFVHGQKRTGVSLDDAAKAAKAQLVAAVKHGRLAMIDVHDEPPNFAERVCKKFHASIPMALFDAKAHGWKKDLLRIAPLTLGCRTAVLACAHPGNYQRLLKPELDPEPWRHLYPIHIKMTPMEVISMHHLVESIRTATAQGRVPLLLDCTTRKGTVDTFFLYQRAFVIDMKTEVLTRLSLLHRPAGGEPTHEEKLVLDGWRKKLVMAMKQGYYLVVSLNDSAVDFVSEYCHDDYLPSAILRCGQITKQQWLDRVVREEDKEHGVFVVRDGFHVVVTSCAAIESYQTTLRACLPLKQMKVVVAMD